MPFLEVEDIHVTFVVRQGFARTASLRAVDGASFALERGESVGLVGESGSGKTTLGNAILGLVEVARGRVTFEGTDVRALSGKALKNFRRRVQMVFQDPYGSLNPRHTIGGAIQEVLAVHGVGSRQDRPERVAALLRQVGLEPEYARRYPHEFSGGQRQRLGIARALALGPSLIVADEPVSALDVSVQVQILNLLKDLQKTMDLSYLFIAHDLAVVRYVCDRILVMYLGRIVERAHSAELFGRPAHPYTQALLSAVPDVQKGLRSRKQGSSRIVLKGDVPSPTARVSGCPFHPRCPRAQAVCRTDAPPDRDVGGGHRSCCHFAAELAGAPRP